MKSLLIILFILTGIGFAGLEVMSYQLTKDPFPVLGESEGDYSTPESTLDTLIWAMNNQDYPTYLECLGENGSVEIQPQMKWDAKLWGTVHTYDIARRTQHRNLVILRVMRDYSPPNNKIFRNQRVDYYFHQRGGRWVYMPEGLTRFVISLRESLWDIIQ